MENCKKTGVIYLLHFDSPLSHARHYLGFCTAYERLDSRFEYHAKGNGSRLLAAVQERGITWRLARLWRGTRNDERAFKNLHAAKKYCPLCSGPTYNRTGLEELDV